MLLSLFMREPKIPRPRKYTAEQRKAGLNYSRIVYQFMVRQMLSKAYNDYRTNKKSPTESNLLGWSMTWAYDAFKPYIKETSSDWCITTEGLYKICQKTAKWAVDNFDYDSTRKRLSDWGKSTKRGKVAYKQWAALPKTLSEAEAAAKLGVSVRTIANYKAVYRANQKELENILGNMS